MNSIRTKLILTCTLSTAILLALLGTGLYLVMYHALNTQFNRSLLSRAVAAISAADWDPKEGFNLDTDVEYSGDSEEPLGGGYLEIWDAAGKVVYQSKDLQGEDLQRLNLNNAQTAFLDLDLKKKHDLREVFTTFSVKSGEDEDDQSAAAASQPAPVQTFYLAAARSTDPLEDTLDILAWTTGVSCVAATLLSALLMAVVVSRGFRPVRDVADQIAAINAADLSARLQPPGQAAELVPIVEKLNGLLERLNEAVRREKALTADMAHELRTPLAGIRTTLELSASRVRSEQEYRQTIDGCLAMAIQMQTMANNLLTLARIEGGEFLYRLRDCRLDLCVQEALAQHTSLIGKRQIKLQHEPFSACLVKTDPDALTLIIRNVLENAFTHVDTGGTVIVTLNGRPDGALFDVRNTGSRISQQQAAHVFERFWRGDEARTAGEAHTGLGLAIVKNIMGLLRGRVIVQSEAGGWFLIQLWFKNSSEALP